MSLGQRQQMLLTFAQFAVDYILLKSLQTDFKLQHNLLSLYLYYCQFETSIYSTKHKCKFLSRYATRF